MKGFTRYFRDPVFKAEVDRQLAQATVITRPKTWITYAIHDPSRIDDIDAHPDGPVVYVGQTKQFGIRVRDRMSSAGRAIKRPTDRIDGLLHDIMSRGPAPRWSVLEEVYSAIDSLVSETNWTIRLRAKGYSLVNQWAEHKVGTLEIDRYRVDPKRLWPITAEDALGSEIDVIIRDPASGEEVLVDLASLPPQTRLQIIKAHAYTAGRRARLNIR